MGCDRKINVQNVKLGFKFLGLLIKGRRAIEKVYIYLLLANKTMYGSCVRFCSYTTRYQIQRQRITSARGTCNSLHGTVRI